MDSMSTNLCQTLEQELRASLTAGRRQKSIFFKTRLAISSLKTGSMS